jgi:hypothetical protein
MQCPWSYVLGSDLTVLYNFDTHASIVLDQTFGFHFCFTSGKGRKCLQIGRNLNPTPGYVPYQSASLLSALQAGQGTKINSSTQINGLEWTTAREGPIIAFRNKSHTSDRLYLTLDGFIYSTELNGAAIITMCSETYTTTEKAKQLLDIAIAGAMKSDSNLRINSLKVSV